jgi:hypothetical protein
MSDDFREVPDHIAVELEFLYLLIYVEDEPARKAPLTANWPNSASVSSTWKQANPREADFMAGCGMRAGRTISTIEQHGFTH